MIRTLALVASLATLSALSSLAACSQVTMDLGAAATRANANGAPERADCYTSLNNSLTPKPVGLADAFEATVELRGLAEGTCAPILGGLFVHLLDKAPLTP